jgi:hypothetical protein
MQKFTDNTAEENQPAPPQKRPSGNLFFILILACWLLFLYFFAGAKGPG